jgi:glutamate-5-semialdehyde dehydrogenase
MDNLSQSSQLSTNEFSQGATLVEQCKQTQTGAKKLATSSRQRKDRLLLSMSKILAQNQEQLIAANKIDLESARKDGLSAAMIDRLTITPKLIEQIQSALAFVAKLDDPLQGAFPVNQQPSGIKVTKKRIPLGVILMIYESRPNVTVEAAALAVKSGNAIILRGGKEAFHSNQAIAQCWREALLENDLSEHCIRVLESTDRGLMDELLKLDELIDVVIPRGGEGLIRYVVANSHIPVIKHYKGVCHLFVDSTANFDSAMRLIINGKTQRPGVCNALEGVLVAESIAGDFLPRLRKSLGDKQVTIYGCAESRAIIPDIDVAGETEFMTEFLDLKMALKVVKDVDEAIAFIDQYGSHHTEVIVTENDEHAQKFINEVDASVVMVNASSRFSDGGELGLGAEIGISTSKLHAYGPMGLESLTSEKFVVYGEGQVRE